MMGFVKRHPKKLSALLSVAIAPLALHYAIVARARETPPAVSVPQRTLEQKGELTRFGDSYVRERGPLLEVGLRGTPDTIGYSHSRLLYDKMVENEGILLHRFDQEVPSSLLRQLLLDLAQARLPGENVLIDPLNVLFHVPQVGVDVLGIFPSGKQLPPRERLPVAAGVQQGKGGLAPQ